MDREWLVPEPRSLADAMNIVVDSGLRTKADLLSVEFTMSAGDVENLTCLPPGWFSARTAEVVQLKQDSERIMPKSELPGVVVPFNRK